VAREVSDTAAEEPQPISRRTLLLLLKGATALVLGWLGVRLLQKLFTADGVPRTETRVCLGESSDLIARLEASRGGFLIDEEHNMLIVARPSDEEGEDDTALAAYSLVCTHLGCSLQATDDARILECPCHGSRFALPADSEEAGHAVGQVLRGPATHDLRRHRIVQRGGRVFLEA
jgi:Rieske Fe-S protein